MEIRKSPATPTRVIAAARWTGSRFRRVVGAALLLIAAVSAGSTDSFALEPIELDSRTDRISVTTGAGEYHERRGETLQVETAPALDGTIGRMSVGAAVPGTNPDWIVFALRNSTDKPITRWITAERYNLIGSGIMWPDLDARRIEALTPSLGFLPERIDNDSADIFQVTVDPGQTITYAAELAAGRNAQVYLWQPTSYRLKVRDRELFNGIMLGIAGLLGVFLTAVFAANHKAIFPSAALVAWCVLAYLCVDFGFWHKLLQLRAEDNAVYRAATESAIAASLLIFASTFLRLGSWNNFVRMLIGVWIAAQIALVFIAVLDPRLSATFARLSFAAIGVVATLVMAFLALRGQDRALSLIPTWILFLVWVFGAAMTLSGKLSGDLVVSSLIAGLVLIIVLIGFTVTQFAFRAPEQTSSLAPTDQGLRAMAVDGAGAAVWEWQARRDEISVSPIVEASLGLEPGVLSTKLEGFCKYLHPADKERFLTVLDGFKESEVGSARIDFRMRHTGNYYRWFSLEASSLPTTDRRSVRCCGLMRDITEDRRTQERLLHDAVHDNLTNLPNRELFLDRLERALLPVLNYPGRGLAVIFVGIDRFKTVNAAYGTVIGDSLLLTIARRLGHHIGSADTLARIGGDQFGVIVHESDPRQIAMLAEKIRRSVRSPIQIAGQDVTLTGAIGIAISSRDVNSPRELFKQAEIAMFRAKRNGADNVEIFRPEMQAQYDQRATIEMDLRRAIDNRQLAVSYQPIIYLPTEELAGFEALVRWKHPALGDLNPIDFIPIAEESDLIIKLGAYVLNAGIKEATKWQEMLPRAERPLFVSVNVSGRQLLKPDLVQEVRRLATSSSLPPSSLQLEVTESLVMDNPEQASEMLARLSEAGVRIALDDFGTGYSSLAYLQKFPINTVKIDKELVRAAMDSDSGAAIVRSIVALSHELGKNVVVEGVEALEDVTYLRALGCEYGQGFYYGDAMTPRAVNELLKVVRRAERRAHRLGFKSKPKPAPLPKPAVTDAPAQIEGPPQRLADAKPQSKRKARADAQRTAPRPGQPSPPTVATPNGHSAPTQPTPAGGRATPPPRPDQRRASDDGLANALAAATEPLPAQKAPIGAGSDSFEDLKGPAAIPAPTAYPAGPSETAAALMAALRNEKGGAAKPPVSVDRTASSSGATVPSRTIEPFVASATTTDSQPPNSAAPAAPAHRIAERPLMPHEQPARRTAANGNGSGHGSQGAGHDPDGISVERLRTLPPGIASSLARLAGMELEELNDDPKAGKGGGGKA